MLTKRFFISWIFSAISMFILSYAWHGVVLNDFYRLSYPKALFLLFAAFVYILIGFVVVKVVEAKFYEKLFAHRPVLKGLVKGSFCGIMFFLIAMVVGVSFNTGAGIKNLVLDLVWQTIEQGVGGGVVGIVLLVTKESYHWDS